MAQAGIHTQSRDEIVFMRFAGYEMRAGWLKKSAPWLFGGIFFLLCLLAYEGVLRFGAERGRVARDAEVFSMTDAERFAYLDSLAGLVVDEPESLSQLVGIDIAGLFGPPDLEREEIPAVMWQYRAPACVLDVYFQIDARGEVSASPVAYYELRSREGIMRELSAGPDLSRCLSEIIGAHRPESGRDSVAQ